MRGIGLFLSLFSFLTLASCGKDSVPKPNSPSPTTANPGCGDSIQLRWTPPVSRTDGSSLDNLYGYEIHWGLAPRTTGITYSDSLTIINNQITSYVIQNLNSNTTYYFAMKAMDADGLISSFSGEVGKSVPSVCQPGQKPIEFQEPTDKYQKPSWCSDTVDLEYSWDSIQRLTGYRAIVGYRRGVPSDEFSFDKDKTGFPITVRRGKMIYVTLEGLRFENVVERTPESMYHVLTCKQLEEKLKENPKFQENLNLELKWSVQ